MDTRKLEDTADELLTAATHRSKSEIERLLAARFPRPDVLAWVEATPASSAARSLGEHAPGHVQAQRAPGLVERSKVKPLSSQSFAVQFTLSRGAYDKLRYAQELLSHQVPSGDIAMVFERALAVLIPQLEKCKFGATARPQTGQRRSTADSRHVPAHVKRAVWEPDGGRCTFVSEADRRCEARKRLEFDHVEEFARGGEATVEGIRLRCRAHNQDGAECTFGGEFMRHKRTAAAESRAAAAMRTAARKRERAAARGQAAIAEEAHVLEVIPWLRQLGFSARESRDAAALCSDMSGASLEERVRVALSCFRPRGTRKVRPGQGFVTAASLACAGGVSATERIQAAAR